MELLQLTYFCTAAELESFSKTAEKYSVPPSSISQSINRLEKELSTKLFDRTPNRITLNAFGKCFYENTKAALTLLNDAKLKLSDKDEISGEIKILVETNRRIVTKAIELFMSKYKNVSFFINNSYEENTNEYDLIITDRKIYDSSLSKEKIVVDDILLAFQRNNPLSRLDKITIKDLENEKFITMGSKTGIFGITNEICSEAGFLPNIVIQSDDPYYIRKYIEMGLGISFIPSVSWQGLFSENVVCRKIMDRKRYTYAYFHSNRYITKAVRNFLDVLISLNKGV